MNKLSSFIISCCLLCSVAAAAQNVNTTYGITSQSVINLQLAPSYAAEMGTQTLMGMPVRILETAHGWYKLMTPEGYTSWTPDDGVKQMAESEFKAWNAAPKVIVTDYFTMLRAQPSETAAVVSDVVWGDIVRNMGENGDYYKVMLPTGKTAFLHKKLAMPFDQWLASRRPTAENIIATAKHFLGFPYFWGGTSVKGMDCSGFTKTSFYLNGVILRRDASQQAQTGEVVDISNGFDNLRLGDLLFFGSKREGKDHVTHVALYIGNGEFIHSSGTIHIGSLKPGAANYDAGNTKRILRARRIITQIDKDSGIVSIKKHPYYQ
jgi:cell wall-associated NlpC family hydrolase